MAHSDISFVTLSRVGGGGVTSSRTFDITVQMNNGTSHQFSSINREEQTNVEQQLKARGIRIKNDLNDDQAFLNAVIGDDSDDSDVEMANRGDRGSASEDEESVDEDFKGSDSDSDVAEEYDENPESSGSDEEEDEADVEEDDDEDEEDDGEDEEPVKKKVKKEAKD